MRIILNCEFKTPKKDMLDSLGWLSVSQGIRLNALLLIFKIKNHLAPCYLTENVKFVNEIHDRNLRNRNDFRLPKPKSENLKNSFFYRAVKMFNDLPMKIKNEKRIEKFKILIKNFIKNNTEIL